MARQKHVRRKVKRSAFQRTGLFFYDHPKLTALLWLVLLVYGILSYGFLLKRQGFPAVSVPVSVVRGTYFVGSQERVDAEVSRPLSEVITGLDEVETVSSTAGDNFFMLAVEYDEKLTSAEGSGKVEAAIRASGRLPQAARVEYQVIDAARLQNKYDMLLAAYYPGETDQTRLEARADALAIELQKYDVIKESEVTNLFETGQNPMTGQQVTEQRRFDRIGVRQGDRFGYYPSVTIGIVGQDNADSLKLSADVRRAINDILSRPEYEDIRLVVSADFAEGIETQISSLQKSLLEGLGVVLLVSFLLVSWRAGLATALGMITVICITLAVLHATDNTLNTITLFALILSLGLIVDDATIMAEALDAAKRGEKTKRDIVAETIKKVARASTAGTLTTMLAFTPMLFIGGVLGSFIRVLPITIIISLACSLLVSLTLIPFLSRFIILTDRSRRARSFNPVQKIEGWISSGLAGLLRLGKRSRPAGIVIGLISLLMAASFIVGSFYFFQKLKFNIFPSTKDTNALTVVIRYRPGTDIRQAQVVADNVDREIRRVLGTNLRRVAFQGTGTAMDAIAMVDLVDLHDREAKSPELVRRLNDAFRSIPEANILASQVDVGPPKDDQPFRAQIRGEDVNLTRRLGEDIAAFLREREIRRPNNTTAKVTRAEVYAGEVVQRTDAVRITEVRAGFDADDTSALVTIAQQAVENEFTPQRIRSYGLAEDSLQFNFGNESSNQESFQSMLIAFPVLLAVMYLLLALQFRSFLQPLLIFMAIPFSFFGVASGLYLTDNPLSFFVMIGFFALIGIAVNNTIMLVDYANQARERGRGRIDAIADAVKARFRPLITTSLTSVVALIPLAIEDPFWESLSFTLIFGLLSSTFLVIVAFPYIYLAGETLRYLGSLIWRRRLWRPLQFVFDVLLLPVRLIAFILYIGFRHKFD